MSHSLTLDQDEDGWDFPTCSCGWVGPPCPDKEIAAEFFTDHAMQSTPDNRMAQLLRSVVMDYADKCCDHLDTCDCAMAQAARLVRDEAGK